MNTDKLENSQYHDFLIKIKQKIQTAQIKAHIQVNRELLKLYWDIGKMISNKQKLSSWGDGFLKQMSKDLQKEFPNMKGFSHRNLKYIKQWFNFWSQETKGKQVVSQIYSIPWGHNILIIQKCKNVDEAIFYITSTVQNNYSRAVLLHQIETNLYNRNGKALTNFEKKLPSPQSDLANQIIKDPYCFDFLELTQTYNEKELENALVENMTSFLLELGQGFAFVGKQYRLKVSDQEYKIDLLFYNIKLHCYVVIELKAIEFKPEFTGKLNFYTSVVDDILRTKEDNPTIGILICKSKNNTIVEYALKDIQKPLGVSEYKITDILPENYKSSLPSVKQIEEELSKVE
jgi:predicted nuclease of restriction endonuclease-like (RecB) superfamily